MPQSTGQTTWNLAIIMSIRDVPFQRNSLAAKTLTPTTPIGSAVFGETPASLMNCEMIALEKMFKRYTSNAGPFESSVAGGGYARNRRASVLGSATAAASLRSVMI